MPIRRIYYGFWTPEEWEYECAICGHSIEEDDAIEYRDDYICPSCAKEIEIENKIDEEDDECLK